MKLLCSSESSERNFSYIISIPTNFLVFKTPISAKKIQKQVILYYKNALFSPSTQKKFRTKIPDFGTFLYGIQCFYTIYTKLTYQLLLLSCQERNSFAVRCRYFRPQHPANPHKHLLFTPFVILPCLINATV